MRWAVGCLRGSMLCDTLEQDIPMPFFKASISLIVMVICPFIFP